MSPQPDLQTANRSGIDPYYFAAHELYREPQNSGTTGATTTVVRAHSQATIVPHGREGSALLESVAIDSFAPLGRLVGVPSEAVRTMADPRGGRREKVKINENSSSAGAIEKLPDAARGTRVRARV
ncbi:hypothetical protein ALC62_13245 [Cyphomyrmex costatus]|uniref:Uncharacterized protein n=1 Tax=Cyphomyrmex costatus TaxID=456900 RepID=A0A195C7S2_9HYME|nr:hypothetical protein ALC62_13245 [Cyphomyrmex costatus]